MSLADLDYRTLRKRLEGGEVCVREVVEAYLERIEERGALNAFISVDAEGALRQADLVQERLRRGSAGRLAGMVLAVKDNIAVAGGRTTCGSRMLAEYVSPYSATVIEKVLAEDAVILGKTNMDEFAMGSSNETSYFGPARHPIDPDRVPGGSSGGSAVAVAAGQCTAALGSDTGGSIRQPAALCGVVGLKPTYGRVSRYGLVAFASSLDQIGPLARTVYDASLLAEVMCGYDPRDSTSVPKDPPQIRERLTQGPRGLRIGLPREYFAEGLQPEVREATLRAARELETLGAEVEEVSLPHTEYAIATYYILATAEASSNLARYDGARYGFRAPGCRTLEEMYIRSRSEGFGIEVKRRIMLGTYVLSAGYYEAYYRRAQKVRTLIREDFLRAFERCDVLLTPTSPTTAFRLGERLADPLTMYLSDVYTVSVNLAGLPAASVPFGRDRLGLPIGVQIIGRTFDEPLVMQVAAALEALGNQN
ncbi:MAG: Asp-tRNA(Asn)/Glu-tRNA(Gln) amidotransferase subunit GatA [candidate division KSB1 bacterium]|nr:Asp-tRNA(Asn)/Glu-tRNA(Gln) amidotransferase subunit GatA [candidate division KSB1 bacterium]